MSPLKYVSLPCAVAAVLVLIASPGPAAAQTLTTGTVSGVVVDQQDAVLPGASVTAVHEPTGTRYEAVTGAEGRYQIPNVRVGPYTVSASLSGFKEQTESGIVVALGEDRNVSFKLQLQSVTEVVNVTAQVPVIDPTRAGAAANVVREAIEQMPTVSRSLTDFARLSPYFNQTATNSGAPLLSVAGRSYRYNTLQIDGAVNNDLFGLAQSAGNPGGSTETQPISLDAIQELQLVVTPYDVRQGGFSGGGVNAITRSGSNTFSGTAYYFGRNQDWVGNGPDNRKFGTFNDKQGGFSVGGPVQKNKTFFFANFDFGRKDQPSGFSISGSGQRFGHEPEALRFRDILKSRYGYDPGGLDEFTRTTNNNKIFVRTDFNLSSRHQLTVRHNYIDAINDIGFPTNTLYLFPDNFYHFRDKTNSTVGQLNSTFGPVYNEFRLTYQRVRDRRDGDTRFPSVEVQFPDGARLRGGREEFSTANELDQDIVELTDDVTLVRGRHTLTIGTHNEFFKFRNLFIRDAFGAYIFTSLDNLAAGMAQSYDFSFSNTPDPLQPARFAVRQFGVYGGDQYRIRPNLTITYGLRIDAPQFPDKPSRNPVSEANYNLRTDITPSPTMVSPRAGFNWDLSNGSNQRQQLRGGAGLFGGRPPYVWLSNQYGNTGVDFTRVRVILNAANAVPLVANPDAQPKTVGGAQRNEIDLVDPNYRYPQAIRSNLAYDRELGIWGLIGTAELIYSKNIEDIAYQNLNLVPTGTRTDGRLVYALKFPALSDVIFLTNTDKGRQWTTSFKLERPFRKGFYASAAYLYGRSYTVNDGTSDQAASNWGNVYIRTDVNDPALAISNFDVRHRITLSTSINIPLGKGITGQASLYYNGQSGRPYADTFTTDANNDGRTTNDLLFVPRDPSEVVIRNGTWTDLDNYINGDESLRDHRGEIVTRNNARAPWVNSLDFRFAAGLPVRRAKVELTMDVLNLINLFDNKSGLVRFANFNQVLPVRFGGVDAATGKMIYDLAPLSAPTFQKFLRDDLRSRWQAQWGLRVRF